MIMRHPFFPTTIIDPRWRAAAAAGRASSGAVAAQEKQQDDAQPSHQAASLTRTQQCVEDE